MAAHEGMGAPPPGLEGAHQAAQYQYYQFYGSQRMVFDGKRVRKRIARKFVDYSSSVVNHYTSAISDRDHRDYEALQPHDSFIKEMMSPLAYLHKPANCIATKFVHTSTNIARCPINVVTWTPEGRRLITGNSSGEFTLWNGSAFNFETIMQAHDSAVRTMIWSHNENWMITGDHDGVVKYWQPNMNFVKAFSAHKEAVRGLRYALQYDCVTVVDTLSVSVPLTSNSPRVRTM
jgi:polyadenylation factor subunit 2